MHQTMTMTQTQTLCPEAMTREEGLRHLRDALPRLGRVYAARRNTAPQPGHAPTTARLSPWLRRRLLTEEEVIAAVRDSLGSEETVKFVQEVYWRTYFKGFLEQHPSIWTQYRAGVEAARGSAGTMRAAAQAEAGRTGIACFDAWAQELQETGWLHNHVRMWFASIWIFTLRLPWELGADVFARALIDFDPASNTLSWRWVAGLHTRGKHYVARAENIARYTDGRFNPAGQLNETPKPLTEEATPASKALPRQQALPDQACALLLHEEDLCPETLIIPGGVATAAVLRVEPEGDSRQRAAARRCCEDARARVEHLTGAPAVVLDGVGDVLPWADGRKVVTPYAPVGPIQEALGGVEAIRLLRSWDESLWPSCGKGYFQLKARVGL